MANEFQMITTTPQGEELGYIDCEIDLEIGEENDFELRIRSDDWDKTKINYDFRIHIPETEYGGLVEDMRVLTKSNEIIWYGYTWRGLLTQKVVEPPENADHLFLNGELNDVIRELIADKFDSLFVVPKVNTEVVLKNWKVDRYVTLYDTIMKFLDANGYRLQIESKKEGINNVYVSMQAVPAKDYSDTIKYDQDCHVDFNVRDYRRGINHLVCAGEGQNEERVVLHLYVQEDGSIGKQKYYAGLSERTAVYNFSSADIKQLEEDGTKRLNELRNYKSIDVTVEDMELELGDIIGGREQVTGIEIKKPIVRKILKIKDGKAVIEYKVKGDD